MKKAIFLAIITYFAITPITNAATYYVDDANGNDAWTGTSPIYISGDTGPVKTINTGLEKTDSNDTVIVADGIYFGCDNLRLGFYGGPLTLKSAKGPEGCIINFLGSGYDWSFDADVLIKNFTIKGIKGGNILLHQQNKITFDNCVFENNDLNRGSSLIICSGQGYMKLNNCIFTDNTTDNQSIIKAIDHANLEIVSCQITETASSYDYSIISCQDDSNATIINTTIDNNWNFQESGIQGIDCSENANVKIIGSIISDNYTYGDFSGVRCQDNVTVVISGCNISDNCAVQYLRGIYVEDGISNLKIADSVIINNAADDSSQGCAVYNRDCNSMQIVNCLITDNDAGIDNYGDGQTSIVNCTIVGNNINHCSCYGIRSTYQTIVSNCIVRDNGYSQIEKDVVVSYSDISDDTDHIWPGIGNINADPLFADPNNGDYHLLSQAGRFDPETQQWIRDDLTSPCIAAGDPNDWPSDEPAGNGGIINMGYYGSTAQASKADFCPNNSPGDINGDCLVNFTDFALMTTDWLTSSVEP